MQSIRNPISEMVRYNNQTLLDRLQSFVPQVSKRLTTWKEHFVNQITLSEKVTMLIFQREIENSTPQ